MASQRGSASVLTALMGLVVLGFGALAVDVGRTVATRTRLQRVADAAALAGCKDLPDGRATATAAALDFAGRNGVALAAADVSFPDGESVRVTVRRPVPTVLARAFGILSYSVPASATATTRAATAMADLVPWGIPAQDFQDYTTGTTYTLKLSSQSDGYEGGGNFHALALDGPGGSDYRGCIVAGSRSRYAVGDSVPTKTGNMVGPTRQGLDDRIGSDSHASFAAAMAAGDADCPRLVTMPVLAASSFGCGKGALTIAGFASFFITGYQNGEVRGQFVRHAVMNAVSDGTPPGMGTQAVALIN